AKGNLLATSVLMKRICADPSLVGTNQTLFARALAPLLQMDETRLTQLLTPVLRHGTNGIVLTNQYVCLSKKVSLDTWSRIRLAMAGLDFGTDEKSWTKPQRAYFQVLR